jgi:Tol biopolymer transport system component
MLFLLISNSFAQATAASPDYPGHCQAPVWSPDGASLAWEVNYLDRKTIELWVAPFTGTVGTPKKVVVASRGSSSLTEGFSGSSESVTHEISFGPSSHYVFSWSGPDRDYDLYLEQGANLTRSPDGSHYTDDGAVWSPDGTHIVFASSRTGQGDLYLLDLQSGAPPLRLTGDETASELYAAWSPDGRKLAFVGHTPNGDNIYLIDNLSFPTPRAITSWNHTQTRPSWSPDGRSIAFYSNHTDSGRYDLYVAPLGGTPMLVDTDVVLGPRGPSWSPDGRDLIYVKQDEGRFNPVYAAPISNPMGAKVVATGTVGNLDLAVTGRSDGSVWLAVAAQGKTGDAVRDFRRIYVMKLSGLP